MTGELLLIAVCVILLVYLLRRRKVDGEIIFRILEILFRIGLMFITKGKAGGGFGGGGGRSGGGGSSGRW